jgi:hypothetical protein
VPRAARQLGFAGLAPFIGLSIASHVGGGAEAALAETLLIGYGAVILSFMGGCRWGFASAGLGNGPSFHLLGLSVLPALYAWIVIWAAPSAAGPLLSVGFALLYLSDYRLARAGGAPDWWPLLRVWLTAGAILSLLSATAV